MDMRRLALSQELKSFRLRQGLTQEELSKNLNRPQSFISKIENCEKNIDLLEFIDVCKALDISVFEALENVINRIEMEDAK